MDGGEDQQQVGDGRGIQVSVKQMLNSSQTSFLHLSGILHTTKEEPAIQILYPAIPSSCHDAWCYIAARVVSSLSHNFQKTRNTWEETRDAIMARRKKHDEGMTDEAGAPIDPDSPEAWRQQAGDAVDQEKQLKTPMLESNKSAGVDWEE